jgi:multidrug efflux pump subunit AcrA (membrane-fusion protein)
MSYTQEEAEAIISKLDADTESAQADARAKEALVLQRQAARKQEREQREARRVARTTRDPMTIWSGYVPISLPPRIRSLVQSMTTPERRVTQGDVLSLALDALERDLAPHPAP